MRKFAHSFNEYSLMLWYHDSICTKVTELQIFNVYLSSLHIIAKSNNEYSSLLYYYDVICTEVTELQTINDQIVCTPLVSPILCAIVAETMHIHC